MKQQLVQFYFDLINSIKECEEKITEVELDIERLGTHKNNAIDPALHTHYQVLLFGKIHTRNALIEKKEIYETISDKINSILTLQK